MRLPGPPYVPLGNLQRVAAATMTLSGLNSPRAEFPIKLFAGDILFFHSPDDDIYGQGVRAPVHGIDPDKQSHAWTGVTVVNIDTEPWFLSVIQVLNPLPAEAATTPQTVCINNATTDLYDWVVLIYRGASLQDQPIAAGDWLKWTPHPNKKLGMHCPVVPFSADKALVVRKFQQAIPQDPNEFVVTTEGGQGYMTGDYIEMDSLVSELLSSSFPFDEYSGGNLVLHNKVSDGTTTTSPTPAWDIAFPNSVWTDPGDPDHWSQVHRWGYGTLWTVVLTTSLQPVTHRPTLGTTGTRTVPMMIASYQNQYRFWLSPPATQTHVQRLRLQALNTPVVGPTVIAARALPLSSPVPLPDVPLGRVECVGRWEYLVDSEMFFPFQVRDGDWLLIVPHLLSGDRIRVEGFTTSTAQGVATDIIDNFPDQRRVRQPEKHCKFVVDDIDDSGGDRLAHIVCWIYRGLAKSDVPSVASYVPFELSDGANRTISAYDPGHVIPHLYGNPNDCCIVVIALHGSKNSSPDIGKPFLFDNYEETFVDEWTGPVGDYVSLPAGQEPYVRLYEFRDTSTLYNSAYFGDGTEPAFPPEERWADWGFMWYLTFFFPTKQLPFHVEDPGNPAPIGLARLPGN
jgi:hypothetical protein